MCSDTAFTWNNGDTRRQRSIFDCSDRPEAIESAIQRLSRAVERDPEWALAHAWLSIVSMNMHFEFDPRPTLLEKAEYHCRRALMLDPALPEAHLAQAWILWSPAKGFQHLDAISALEQVLAVHPNLERAHHRMSAIGAHIGRLHESLVAHERARRSNPKTRTANLEFYYLYSGDFARAEEAGEALSRERPGSSNAVYFHPLPALVRGKLELAEQRVATGLELFPDDPHYLSLQGILHARRNDMRQRSSVCERRSKCRAPSVTRIMSITKSPVSTQYLGATDKTMAWLERSVDTGFACWPFFRIDPHLEPLREKAEFKQLVTDLERKYNAQLVQGS